MSLFANSSIYKLTFGNSEHFYIGSTTRKLKHRLSCHKDMYINHDDDLFNMIMDSDLNEWKIELIEKFPCDNRNDLRKREQYFINLLKPTMNKNKAYVKNGNLKIDRQIRLNDLSQEKANRKQREKEDKIKQKEEYQAKFMICECGKKVYNIPYKMNIHIESVKHKKYLKTL